MPKETIVIGKAVSSHGIRGEISVYPLTDDVDRFFDLSYVIFDGKEFNVTGVRIHKGQALIKLEGVETRDKADMFKGKFAEVNREDSVELGDGEWFIEDLKGLLVFDRASNKQGKLKDVLQTGAVDILVIEVDGKEMMMPFLNKDAGNIDLSAGKMEADFDKLV